MIEESILPNCRKVHRRCATRLARQSRRSSILNKKKEDNPRIPKDSGARKVSIELRSWLNRKNYENSNYRDVFLRRACVALIHVRDAPVLACVREIDRAILRSVSSTL